MTIEITDNSGIAKEKMQAAALRALEICGFTADGYAKLLCPVDTGNLRNSIAHQVQPTELAAYIGTNSEYGAYVELGTGKYYPGGRKTPWVYQDAKGRWHLTHGCGRPCGAVQRNHGGGNEAWMKRQSRLRKRSCPKESVWS